MKRKILPIVLLLMSGVMLKAQSIDLRVSPLALLYRKIEISGEYALSPNKGLELGFEHNIKRTSTLQSTFKYVSQDSIVGKGDVSSSKTAFYLHQRFYMNPKTQNDGFNLGVYLRFKQLTTKFKGTIENKFYDTTLRWPKLILGGTLGYKYVGSSNFIFGFSTGLGYAVFSNIKSDIGSVNKALKSLLILRLDYFGELSVGYRFSY